MDYIKIVLIGVTIVGQFLGMILLLFNIKVAVGIFVISGLSIVSLFIVLIKERIKEKEEDDRNDYRDYGKEVKELKGFVKGNTIQSKHMEKDILAGLKTIVGGENDGRSKAKSDWSYG